nr:uncharacterized protein LOC109169483 [Ipomoea batatas]
MPVPVSSLKKKQRGSEKVGACRVMAVVVLTRNAVAAVESSTSKTEEGKKEKLTSGTVAGHDSLPSVTRELGRRRKREEAHDHQDYPYYSNHYENEEYMMQPYEEENTEDMKNKILARIEELKQEMANIREKLKQESRQRTSSLGQETQASIRTLEDQKA